MDAKLPFGERLAAWRKSKNFTQQQLADISGLNRVAIANIESGHRGTSPAWDTVQKLSAAMGISPELLTNSLPEESASGAPAPKRGRPRKPAPDAAARPAAAAKEAKAAKGKRKGSGA